MSCKVVTAAQVSRHFRYHHSDARIKPDACRDEIKAAMQADATMKPKLVAFLANDDPAARAYSQWTAKACRDTGIEFEVRECARTDLEERIINANDDESVHGIMVYYPVFGDPQDQYIQSVVTAEKDVEGLCHTYKFNMYHNVRFVDKEKTKKCIIPCTPLACVKILEHLGCYNHVLEYGNRLHGKTITIINRSEIVGRPLAALLANDGARVFSVDVNGILEFHRGEGLSLKRHDVIETTKTLDQVLPISDVVITGVPSKNYKVDSSLMKEGVVAVNFSTFNNFNEDVKSKASLYVSSVGKVTCVMLERNLLRLYQYQKRQ